MQFQLVFAEVDTLNIKLIWKCKEPRIVKTIFKGRVNMDGRVILADSKTYYKASVIKTMDKWYSKVLVAQS